MGSAWPRLWSFPEAWLAEAWVEVQVPLLRWIRELPSGQGLTVSLSPTLVSGWAASGWKGRLEGFLAAVERVEASLRAVGGVPKGAREAAFLRWSQGARFLRDEGANLAGPWAALADAGKVSLWTTAASHGVLPLLAGIPGAVEAQLAVGQAVFERCLGRPADGLWLPECAWSPDILAALEAAGVRQTILDLRSLRAAGRGEGTSGRIGVPEVFPTDRPFRLGRNLVAWVRDGDTAERVWSRSMGYPGHPAYREFHHHLGSLGWGGGLGGRRKADGIDDTERCPAVGAPVEGETGPQWEDWASTAVKCWRVSDRGQPKGWYHAEAAQGQVRRDAADFVERLRRRGRAHRGRALYGADGAPTGATAPLLVVAPYDAELFGHWWHEGPDWLEAVFRAIEATDGEVVAWSLEQWQRTFPGGQATPSSLPGPCSWGQGGDFRQWLDPEVWPWWAQLAQAGTDAALVAAARQLRSLTVDLKADSPLTQRARAWLLAQASDWPFMVANNTAAEVALTQWRALQSAFSG